MKITRKKYYCPVCKNESDHQTNHNGEIYPRCKKCGAGVLYLKGQTLGIPEAVKTLIYYCFNIENEKEKIQYQELKTKLKGLGYKIFSCIEKSEYMKYISKYHNTKINLFNIKQFDNQFISDIGRVFYWKEAYYPNKDIKEGYYLID